MILETRARCLELHEKLSFPPSEPVSLHRPILVGTVLRGFETDCYFVLKTKDSWRGAMHVITGHWSGGKSATGRV